ncbi:hypothetical protein G647_04043 [Cladophialophora carrionii CBS 160.54]|uniref:UBA domain-containing protein n=1 Tax=Cladophialophora carrionii CBS 160.54 TaxID=1279043 RepID=V9DCP6_9EURO|nr:uncharacterized protein G647_04043 [Cladophialophora carrionii CBS 160.54]ETI24674.1 hypothetical protein G647_04043 [Cladophialophora carrionii CBS 160.54]
MDDIAGLNWDSTPGNGQKPATLTSTSTSNYSAFSTLKPTPPASGRASPLNPASSQAPSKPSTPANDSFANLISFGSTSNKNLSLLEQQKRQAEAKLHEQKAQHQNLTAQYAGGDEQFWNNLGSRRGSPAISNTKTQTTRTRNNALDDDDDDDLFAAFNKSPPAENGGKPASVERDATNNDDDDPFGLAEAGPRRADTAATTTTVDDDDVLGLLGKPVSARQRHESPPPARRNGPTNLHPQDQAVAELVDMGFPPEKAKVALEATESGLDVQAAVGILLNQAHAEARQKTQSRNGQRQGVDEWAEGQQSRVTARWDDSETSRKRPEGAARAQDRDIEKMAAEFGANFFKTANSLWKQGTKQIQKAVQEFNSDTESAAAQPKWMRETAERPARKEHQPREQEVETKSTQRRRSPGAQVQSDLTNEAMMLEGSRPAPPSRPSASSQRPERSFIPGGDSSRDRSPAMPSRLRESLPQTQPVFLRQQNQSPAAGLKASLNRAAAEEQAAQAYVSSARRRKPQSQPPASPPPVSNAETDLLEGSFKDSAPKPSRQAAPSIAGRPHPPRPQTHTAVSASTPPIQVRPPPPNRQVPSVSAIALKASHTAREKGNDHFKRGDYASAHQAYATSLSHLPDSHPLTIILLTNRALTALKTGEPKSAILDADKAIGIIGPSKGENETVDAGDDTVKPMREYYGKALMRKAEALEQMEKWADAALVWREAVEGGHGGATSIQGRMRAEKAANPQASRLKPATPQVRKTASAPPASQRNAAASAKPAEAVSRLRAANALAERQDDEKFRLSDAIDARINSWKGGKQDNLRALLGSLDQVLWEGSGWKKISMADLVLPGKVKIQYMKGIGRVHPDKVRLRVLQLGSMVTGEILGSGGACTQADDSTAPDSYGCHHRAANDCGRRVQYAE